MGKNSLYNRVVRLTYRTADMIGEERGCTGPVATGELGEELPTGARGHPQQPHALDNEGEPRSVQKVEEARSQHCRSKKWYRGYPASWSMLEWLKMKARPGVDIEYRQWCPHDSGRSVSTSECPKLMG